MTAQSNEFAQGMAQSNANVEAPQGGSGAGTGEPIGRQERQVVLWLTNFSHAMNHFQLQLVTGLYPLIMVDLGLSPFQLGQISAVRHVFNWTQGGYGLVTPFVPRPMILAIGNLTMALGTLLTGFSASFLTFLGARAVTQVGSGGQHPVGASLLSSYFPTSLGTVLAFNNSIATVGSLLAPATMGLLVLAVGWHQLYWGAALLGLLVAVPYLFLGDVPLKARKLCPFS